MRKIEMINTSNVKVVEKIPLQSDTLELAIKLYTGELSPEDLPAIHTEVKNGTHYVQKGIKRWTASKLAEIDQIKCKFKEKIIDPVEGETIDIL